MKNLEKTLKSIVENPKYIFRLSVQGVMVGIFAGLMVCLYRFLLSESEHILRNYLTIIQTNVVYIVLFFVFLAVLGLLIDWITKWEVDSSGSGIPQVYAEVKGHMEANWAKVLFSKIVAGVMTALGGLSLGPEGPSVQIGGMAGKGVARLFKGSKTDELRLILVGSAVGITAAFNAPLAGVLFVMEEINHGFDKTLIFIALVSAIVSDFISKSIFGQSTVLTFPINNIPLENYWILIVLGIVIGVIGYVYNIGMIKSSDFVNSLKIPSQLKFVAVFIISGVVALTIPQISDGGHFMMDMLGVAIPSLGVLVLLLVLKYLFSMFSFSSGAPGGIFLPILVLGAYIGAIFGSVVVPALGMEHVLIYKFIVISMAGFFAATVRSPITGIVLIAEMCGSTESLVAMIIVSLIAYVVPTILGNEPIYESLYDRLLLNKNREFVKKPSKHVLSEYVVPLDCDYINFKIKDIPFPKNAIVVSVIRNGKYIIPTEDFNIKYSDQVQILTDVNDYPYVREEIEELFGG
ncbi:MULTISPECIES: ClC family H(+)/Cl(-) exchange transporter [Methanobrevibacter]|uniref:ClC family H(+)/Cl(-) exchange transporter n=1 Tax=Methanobrevibacter TaxID=2172 RepID=UPI0025E635EE|nr:MULTISPECIES: ClC family H(+)/Cl(-) exchange transporter [Methanobrevibacter]MBS7256921.1 chloride channel protein [Methanobrevibacter sp.]MCI7427738.1 chloride channel protein [Methanobrevibacter sp.]MCI7632863.1 chloride channel protein [Mollicutes bacterium]MDY3096534.1 chloride channel protein [Methanobrevibacter sp.]